MCAFNSGSARLTLPAVLITIKYKFGSQMENSILAALNKCNFIFPGSFCLIFCARLGIFLNVASSFLQKIIADNMIITK